MCPAVQHRVAEAQTPDHSPMTWPICVAVALEMKRVGHVGAAIGTLLAFDGYLRVNELAALRSGDVVVLGDLVGRWG